MGRYKHVLVRLRAIKRATDEMATAAGRSAQGNPWPPESDATILETNVPLLYSGSAARCGQ